MESPIKTSHLRKILERNGPFCHSDFKAGQETVEYLATGCKVLVIGCGGLGCEILTKLVLMGFTQIHAIDMDTIDLSNLNRQFLFRQKDIGRSKAETAAEFLNQRYPHVKIVPHFCTIQDKDESFYRQFHIVISGLDSIVARRWINAMLINLLHYENDELDKSSIIPLIDGGTEGFKGNCRVIYPGLTACIECTLNLFPPQRNFPLCTIANTPRLPEHCIEYVRLLLWPQENPFGSDVNIDTDDPAHVNWIYEKSLERAEKFHINGVTYRLTSGVIKHIVPAVASTNAIIASACVTEAFKMATTCHSTLNNYMVFNNTDGVYSYTYEQERTPNCLVCSKVPSTLQFKSDDLLEAIIESLRNDPKFQMKSPALTTSDQSGNNHTLYMPSIPFLEQQTRPNLKKTLQQLDLQDGQKLFVADPTTPSTVEFILRFV